MNDAVQATTIPAAAVVVVVAVVVLVATTTTTKCLCFPRNQEMPTTATVVIVVVVTCKVHTTYPRVLSSNSIIITISNISSSTVIVRNLKLVDTRLH
jgi:hypothetical protein